jgi:UDP:flavonoid glycosyltransferase YjiC (YdhE family)
VEHFIDQIYWGQQLHRIGVAGKPLHRRSITAKKLANGIHAVLNSPSMKKKAQEIGEIMRKEDGVNKAVKLIENRFC